MWFTLFFLILSRKELLQILMELKFREVGREADFKSLSKAQRLCEEMKEKIKLNRRLHKNIISCVIDYSHLI